MKKTTIIAIFIVGFGSCGYLLGLWGNTVFGTWNTMLSPVIFAVIGGLCNFFLNILLDRSDEEAKETLGRTLTIRTVDGYTIATSDIPEAIDKLGYIEHELKGEI